MNKCHSESLVNIIISDIKCKKKVEEDTHNILFDYSDDFYFEYIKKYRNFDKKHDIEFKKTIFLLQVLMALWIFGKEHNINYAVNLFNIMIKYDDFLIQHKEILRSIIDKIEQTKLYYTERNNIKELKKIECIKYNYLKKLES